jgi:hypothetical protein
MRKQSRAIQELNGRRSDKLGVQEARPWAVATPLCAAFQPPNDFVAGGRYRPSESSRLVAPLPSEVAIKLSYKFG